MPPASFSVTRPFQPYSHFRHARSFDEDADTSVYGGASYNPTDQYVEESDDFDSKWDMGLDGMPGSCLWEILKRLPPWELLTAAAVRKGWRDAMRRLWKVAKMLRITVLGRAEVGLVAQCCKSAPVSLICLLIRMERNADATLLSSITSSCPNLEVLEISTSETATNWITGDELGRFVVDRRLLKSLKMEGCSNLGGFSLCSSSMCTIRLSGLHCLSKMTYVLVLKLFNCPNLKEIYVDFAGQENDNTDLVAMVDILGKNCPRLRNIHIASIRLSEAVVLALTAAHLRGLRMLSLVLGSEITDASVASTYYPNLERLDVSGSSITESGIAMICNVFPDTLSRLPVPLRPNISSSFIKFTIDQLPPLELLDGGTAIWDHNSVDSTSDVTSDRISPQPSNVKVHKTTAAFLFFDKGVFIGVDTRTTKQDITTEDPYIELT